MTVASQGGGPDPMVRAAVIPAAGRSRTRAWWRTATARRYAFGYALLAPAALYVLLLVGAPFLFSLYLALSDANAGELTSSWVGLENFRSALESDVFWIALRNSVVFTVVAAGSSCPVGVVLGISTPPSRSGRPRCTACGLAPAARALPSGS